MIGSCNTASSSQRLCRTWICTAMQRLCKRLQTDQSRGSIRPITIVLDLNLTRLASSLGFDLLTSVDCKRGANEIENDRSLVCLVCAAEHLSISPPAQTVFLLHTVANRGILLNALCFDRKIKH